MVLADDFVAGKELGNFLRRGIGRVGALRMVSAAALAGSVAPMMSRYFAIALSPSSTCTTTGPEIMKSTSSPKNGRSLCTA
jgi:hypothetical protein